MIDLGRCYRQDLLADLGPVLKQITISPADSEIRPRITCAHTITCECYMANTSWVGSHTRTTAVLPSLLNATNRHQHYDLFYLRLTSILIVAYTHNHYD
jgi:hypothetical protein